MNRFKEKIGITLFAVVSSIQAITAFATDGGMTGGGGKIIRDSENP